MNIGCEVDRIPSTQSAHAQRRPNGGGSDSRFLISQGVPGRTPDHHGLSGWASAHASRQIQRETSSPILHSFANSSRCNRRAESSELCAGPLSRASIRRILERPDFRGWLACSGGYGSPGGAPQSAARWISYCSCSCSPPSRKTGGDLAATERELAANGTLHLRIIGGNIAAPWTDARNSFSLGTCQHILFSAATANTGLE